MGNVIPFNTVDNVDLFLVTALTEEAQVVTAVMSQTAQKIYSHDHVTFYDYQIHDMTILRIATASAHQMGAVDMGVFAARQFERFRPRSAALVGIAAAVDAGELRLGDVPFASQILSYDDIAIENGVLTFRTEGYQVDPRMRRAVGELRSSPTVYQPWQNECVESIASVVKQTNALKPQQISLPSNLQPPHLVVEVAAGGPFLLRDRDFRNSLRTSPEQQRLTSLKITAPVHPKLVSVEMESHGFMRAAREHGVPASVIKGISDLGDHDKAKLELATKGFYRVFACCNAVLATLHILRSIERGKPLVPGRRRNRSSDGNDRTGIPAKRTMTSLYSPNWLLEADLQRITLEPKSKTQPSELAAPTFSLKTPDVLQEFKLDLQAIKTPDQISDIESIVESAESVSAPVEPTPRVLSIRTPDLRSMIEPIELDPRLFSIKTSNRSIANTRSISPPVESVSHSFSPENPERAAPSIDPMGGSIELARSMFGPESPIFAQPSEQANRSLIRKAAAAVGTGIVGYIWGNDTVRTIVIGVALALTFFCPPVLLYLLIHHKIDSETALNYCKIFLVCGIIAIPVSIAASIWCHSNLSEVEHLTASLPGLQVIVERAQQKRSAIELRRDALRESTDSTKPDATTPAAIQRELADAQNALSSAKAVIAKLEKDPHTVAELVLLILLGAMGLMNLIFCLLIFAENTVQMARRNLNASRYP